MQECYITTEDNPFNIFEDFDNWKQYDEDHNYFTCEYIARVRDTYPQSIDSEDEQLIMNQVFDDIIELNLLGNYKKVFNDYN